MMFLDIFYIQSEECYEAKDRLIIHKLSWSKDII
jgi:hypothetical protein